MVLLFVGGSTKVNENECQHCKEKYGEESANLTCGLTVTQVGDGGTTLALV